MTVLLQDQGSEEIARRVIESSRVNNVAKKAEAMNEIEVKEDPIIQEVVRKRPNNMTKSKAGTQVVKPTKIKQPIG